MPNSGLTLLGRIWIDYPQPKANTRRILNTDIFQLAFLRTNVFITSVCYYNLWDFSGRHPAIYRKIVEYYRQPSTLNKKPTNYEFYVKQTTHKVYKNQIKLLRTSWSDVAPRRLYILCWREHSRCKLSAKSATAYYSCPDNASSPMWTQRGLNWATFGGRWAEIFTQTWQPCHSWSSKMAGRRRHCRQ